MWIQLKMCIQISSCLNPCAQLFLLEEYFGIPQERTNTMACRRLVSALICGQIGFVLTCKACVRGHALGSFGGHCKNNKKKHQSRTPDKRNYFSAQCIQFGKLRLARDLPFKSVYLYTSNTLGANLTYDLTLSFLGHWTPESAAALSRSNSFRAHKKACISCARKAPKRISLTKWKCKYMPIDFGAAAQVISSNTHCSAIASERPKPIRFESGPSGGRNCRRSN